MKILNIFFVMALSTCFIMHVCAQDDIRHLSLMQACKLASDSNLQVLNAQLETRKTHYQLRESQSKLYPQINGYSDLNYYYAIPRMMMPGEMFGGTGEVAMEIGTKYDWNSGFKASLSLINLSNFTAIKLAKRMQNMSELSFEQKKEEIVYQVSQIYYLCQSTQSQINYLNKNIQNTDHLLSILKSQSENGVTRKIDYSKVLVTKNNLQTQIDNLERVKEQQLSLLKYLTGTNLNTRIELTDSLSFENKSVNIEMLDFSNHIDIKLIDKQFEVAKLNKQAIDQSYLPTLSTSGQFYYQGQQNEFNYFKGSDKFFKVGFIGLNLSVPIFDGLEKHAKAQQYKVEMLQLQNTRKNTTESIQKDYYNAVNQVNNSTKAVTRQQKNIKIAEEDYSISLQKYNQHTMLLSDLILSENSLTEARLSLVDALLQLKNAELELKKLKGELLKF